LRGFLALFCGELLLHFQGNGVGIYFVDQNSIAEDGSGFVRAAARSIKPSGYRTVGNN
jgi:hypothetical protein